MRICTSPLYCGVLTSYSPDHLQVSLVHSPYLRLFASVIASNQKQQASVCTRPPSPFSLGLPGTVELLVEDCSGGLSWEGEGGVCSESASLATESGVVSGKSRIKTEHNTFMLQVTSAMSECATKSISSLISRDGGKGLGMRLDKSYYTLLALFPGHPVLITCSTQKRREKAWENWSCAHEGDGAQ